jgi:hypothetical protein
MNLSLNRVIDKYFPNYLDYNKLPRRLQEILYGMNPEGWDTGHIYIRFHKKSYILCSYFKDGTNGGREKIIFLNKWNNEHKREAGFGSQGYYKNINDAIDARDYASISIIEEFICAIKSYEYKLIRDKLGDEDFEDYEDFMKESESDICTRYLKYLSILAPLDYEIYKKAQNKFLDHKEKVKKLRELNKLSYK